MTAKLTARQIRSVINSKNSLNSVEREVPEQKILKLYSPGRALMRCAVHGQYIFTAKRLTFAVGKLGPCPECKTHYLQDRSYRHKKIARDDLLAKIESGSLKYTGPDLPRSVPMSSTELGLQCLKCENSFTINAKKFNGWNTKGDRTGCAWCRNNNPRWYTHKEYLRELKGHHGDKVTPLFTYNPRTMRKLGKQKFRCHQGHTWTTRPVLVARQGHGCKFCAAEVRIHERCTLTYRHKDVEYKLDSAGELLVLKALLKKYGSGSVQRSEEAFEVYGRGHRYYPDFFMPKKDLYVEVKSVATLGLTTYRGDRAVVDVQRRFEKVRATFHTMFATGNKIRLVVATKTDFVTLPEDWFTWTYSEVVSFLRMRGYRIPDLSDRGESIYIQTRRRAP